MSCLIMYGTLPERIFLSKLRNCMQLFDGFKSSKTLSSVSYFQPLHRYFKTSTILQSSNASETREGVTEEKNGIIAGDCMGEIVTSMEKGILPVLTKYPNLEQISAAQLNTILCNLCELGFSVDDGVEMVNKCTDILRRSPAQLLCTVSSFRHCGFEDKDVLAILVSAPEFLLIDPNAIVSRYQSLRRYFSHKLLKHIFLNCTSVVQMEWRVMFAKLEYLKNVMSVTYSEIAHSKTLDYPLYEIKARHLFLERAGVYKVPDPKSNIPSKNHKLSEIMDTEDEYFAEEIAGLTAEEYFVFQELLALENDESDEEHDE